MKLTGITFRTLVFTHRYIGMTIGVLMLLWCLSGFVMMYVPFPSLDAPTAMRALKRLNNSPCCALPATDLLDERMPITSMTVAMLGNVPVARIDTGDGRLLMDMRTGDLIEHITYEDALATAQQYAESERLMSHQPTQEQITLDQWTVYGNYGRDRPLHHVQLHDAAGSEIYVSGTSGRIVLVTTRMQRFWNWLGAVPHWLYFTALRQHSVLWNQVVTWTSLVGVFLTAFGLWLGFWQLRRKSSTGQIVSPYHGLKWWHHVPGLFFGVLVLTWILSGLFSMQPWGFLESAGKGSDAALLQGAPPEWRQIRSLLQNLNTAQLPADTLQLEMAPLHSQIYMIANTRDGRQRLNAQLQAAPVADAEINEAAELLTAGAHAQWTRLTEEDFYYYSHGADTVTLPVIRVLRDDAATRYYIDPISGALLSKLDSDSRAYRWLHYGLHRMDFPILRLRPVWDIAMWLMLLGVTAVCATGAWMGMKRLLNR